MSKALRHFLDLSEVPTKELRRILDASVAMKAKLKASKMQGSKLVKPLEGKTLAMIFEKPSTRTRVSFDVGMRQLGGDSIMLTGAEMQLGRGETIADTARVLSRYVDAIMIRILNHDALLELAAFATVPVINGLTRRSHPCQVMADLMTFEEHRGPIEGRTVAWTGDDNNVLASWAHAAERFQFKLNVATPPQLAPNKAMKDWIKATQAPIVLGNDPEAAVRGVDCVVTDTWFSMGDKDGEHRHNLLKPYQVNAKLMSLAKPDALFMHCLPAHRGDEVTDEVIDGPQSVVFDEAENRLHAQKGILAWCFDAVRPGPSPPPPPTGGVGPGGGGASADSVPDERENLPHHPTPDRSPPRARGEGRKFALASLKPPHGSPRMRRCRRSPGQRLEIFRLAARASDLRLPTPNKAP
jgi:ornithine carbamoyltransferase